jgi:hypothetical protein
MLGVVAIKIERNGYLFLQSCDGIDTYKTFGLFRQTTSFFQLCQKIICCHHSIIPRMLQLMQIFNGILLLTQSSIDKQFYMDAV